MSNDLGGAAAAKSRLSGMWGSTEVTATSHSWLAGFDVASRFGGTRFAEIV